MISTKGPSLLGCGCGAQSGCRCGSARKLPGQLAGNWGVSNNEIVWSGSGDKLTDQDYLALAQVSAGGASSAQAQQAADVLKKIGSYMGGKSWGYVWDRRQTPAQNAAELMAIAEGLAGLVGGPQGYALANLLGGMAMSKNWLGSYTAEPPTSASAYLDLNDLGAVAGNGSYFNARSLALQLRAANPVVFNYWSDKYKAYILKRFYQIEKQTTEDTYKVIKTEAAIAQKVISIPVKAAGSLLDTAGSLASFAGPALVIAGLAVGYLYVRPMLQNR